MLVKRKFTTPLGNLVALAGPNGLQKLFVESQDQFLKTPEDPQNPILNQCEQELHEYFGGERILFTVPLDPQGTLFQKNVWNMLLKIPYGTTISYGAQAKMMGRASSVRAVAAANGRNPIWLMIPCHRVVAATGHLHGYAGGLERKQKLLELEGVKIENLHALGSRSEVTF